MKEPGLLGDRRFKPLFWTQFLGALNDNLFKTVFVFMILFGSLAGSVDGERWTPILNGVFILPFFLFSSFGGQLADKLEKARLVRVVKASELGVMAMAALGFLLESPWVLASSLFLMGTQSAFFGPVKYGILPQLVARDQLVAANAMVGTATFIAILIGTIGGGLLATTPSAGASSAALVMAIALAGALMSCRVPRVPASDPSLRLDWNPLRQALRSYRFASEDETVQEAIFGVAWFWFVGATIVTLLPVYGRYSLGVDAGVVTSFLASFCVGIGIGALVSGRFARYRIELGLVPVAALGLSLFAFDLFLTSGDFSKPATLVGIRDFLWTPGSVRILIDLTGIAMCGGMYSVPLGALVQARADSRKCSRILSAGAILQALFMVASSGLTFWMAYAQVPPPVGFAVLAIMNGVVVIYIARRVPETMARLAVWCLVRLIYRLRVRGLDNVPAQGGAVLVANHVTYLDALVLTAAMSRPVRFVMHYKFAEVPILGRLVERARVIPIATRSEDPGVLREALDEIAGALEAGEVVCIFPEGTLTQDGCLGPFRKGVEHIVKRTPVPVVPMRLQGLGGSVFSRMRKRARLWPRVDVVAGAPIVSEAVSAALLEERVGALV